MKHISWLLPTIFIASLSGCHTFTAPDETGVVIARRAQVRSSTAIVAADLKEVVRGDVLEILSSTTAEGEKWLHVRTRDAETTEGWIEERNVLLQDMLDRSVQLAKEDESIPAQASGQLRASTNIRLSPDRSVSDNILMKLESGAKFDIVGWKHVPITKVSEVTESDDAPRGVAQQRNKKSREAVEPKELESNELWYKVRLPRSISPSPSGWVYGKQVELTVPSDIIFYRTGREFVAWHRLDDVPDETFRNAANGKDTAKEARPGSWVILEKSSGGETGNKRPSEFDRIFVLGYDKERQEHYTAYRSPDIDGYLPLRVDGSDNNKTFTVKAQEGGGVIDLKYRVLSDNRGLLKVEAPRDSLKKR